MASGASTWARANTTSKSTTISTTSNSSRRNFIQGSGAGARIGDRSELPAITATTKLGSCAFTRSPPLLLEAMEQVGTNFCHRRHAISRSLCVEGVSIRESSCTGSWRGCRRLDGWVPARSAMRSGAWKRRTPAGTLSHAKSSIGHSLQLCAHAGRTGFSFKRKHWCRWRTARRARVTQPPHRLWPIPAPSSGEGPGSPWTSRMRGRVGS